MAGPPTEAASAAKVGQLPKNISPSFIFFRVVSPNYAYFQFMHIHLELKLASLDRAWVNEISL